MRIAFRRVVPFVVLAISACLLPGCGREDKGPGNTMLGFDLNQGVRTFWARDTGPATPVYYPVNAVPMGEGTHCRVYREVSQIVPDNVVQRLILEFDNVIYPADTAAFGREPNPGEWDVDGDPKITILLLDIKDKYAAGTDNSTYTATYFSLVNEYPQSYLDGLGLPDKSNAREMIYVDINPLNPSSETAFRMVAGSFERMIHWYRKWHFYGVADDEWLEDAMSEVAHAYCGYTPNYGRVRLFQLAPWNSLTRESSRTLTDDATAFMWAMYFRDRFDNTAIPNTVFRDMLESPFVGIAAADYALTARGTGISFAKAFEDWAIANASAGKVAWDNNPEWGYRSLELSAGSRGGVQVPGTFHSGNQDNTSLRAVDAWALGYYWYLPPNGLDGRLSWNPSLSVLEPARAAYVTFDNTGTTVTLPQDMTPGAQYPYASRALVILRNASGTPGAESTMAFDIPPLGPAPGAAASGAALAPVREPAFAGVPPAPAARSATDGRDVSRRLMEAGRRR